MNFSVNDILTLTPKQAARILYEAGRDLKGKNLRRKTWLEMVTVIQAQQRIGEIVLQRLQGATTREDALRALRIARKARRRKRSGGASRARRAIQSAAEPPSPGEAAAFEDYWDEIAWMEEPIYQEIFFDGIWGTQEDYQAWLAERKLYRLNRNLRWPDLLPASPVQEFISAYAVQQSQPEVDGGATLGQVLDAETYQRMRAAVVSTALNLTKPEQAFVERYASVSLKAWVEQIEQVKQRMTPAVIKLETGFDLAVFQMLVEKGVNPALGQIDWPAVGVWLVESLSHPPNQHAEAVIRGAYAYFTTAPSTALTALWIHLDEFHPDWVLGLLYSRARQLGVAEGASLHGELKPTRWENLLFLNSGSKLTLNSLRYNYVDIFQSQIEFKAVYRERALFLLLAGAGSLRRMDYPDFRIVCRRSLSAMDVETFTGLLDTARILDQLHQRLARGDWQAILTIIAEAHFEQYEAFLPDPLLNNVAAKLEQHVIAYVLLKAVVLADDLAETSFRLRRKHIRRFWQTYQAGDLDDIDLPADLYSLSQSYPLDLVKEGLVHAMLDHLQESWLLESDRSISLKTGLTQALRTVALTYNWLDPELPVYQEYGFIEEEDLVESRTLADFLFQQMVQAPLELIQALRLPHDQGLPRLQGGRLSPVEHYYRQWMKTAFGLTALDGSDLASEQAQGRIYTCRPLSKIAALDRGNLGGDCSSRDVPFRALSPHHTYYGVFDEQGDQGNQQRGYMTVFEAWAESVDGVLRPVLCLETINIPLKDFDAVQPDLLLIFEAIAKSRGLYPGLVLITDVGTWNYHNQYLLRQSRRFRQGKAVRLSPADPVQWGVYHHLAIEAGYYNAFESENHHRREGHLRLLAPFNPTQDSVQPENQAEAERLAALPPKKLKVTARTAERVAGFISEWPDLG